MIFIVEIDFFMYSMFFFNILFYTYQCTNDRLEVRELYSSTSKLAQSLQILKVDPDLYHIKLNCF